MLADGGGNKIVPDVLKKVDLGQDRPLLAPPQENETPLFAHGIAFDLELFSDGGAASQCGD